MRSARSLPKPTAIWKSSSTERCASPTRANAFRRKPGEAEAPTAGNARRPAACLTNCWWTDASNLWRTRAICCRPAISMRCARFRRSSKPASPRSRSKAAIKTPTMSRSPRALTAKLSTKPGPDAPLSITPQEELQLEQVYSRGLGPFFLTGTNHQAVVEGRAPRHRGVKIGRVTRVESDRVIVEPAAAHEIAPLKPGDGVVFDAADWRSPEEPEEGGRLFAVRSHLSGEIELQFGNGAVRFARIRAGDWLWRTHDPEIDRIARPFLDPSAPMARQRVNVSVEAREGAALRAVWSLETQPQISVWVESSEPLHPAQNRGVTVDSLREQFGRLGNTAYELGEITLYAEGSLFAAVSALNQMRRDAVEKLQAAETHRPPVEIHDAAMLKKVRRRRAPSSRRPNLNFMFWFAPRSNWTQHSHSRQHPPASRWTIWISTACVPRSIA